MHGARETVLRRIPTRAEDRGAQGAAWVVTVCDVGYIRYTATIEWE